jgi:hypothetical protein
MTSDARELAKKLLSWMDAGVDPLTFAMRLSATDREVVREAMRIMREELIPRAAEQEADEGFRRSGRYLTAGELLEMRRENEAKRDDFRKGNPDRRYRLKLLIRELGAMVHSDHSAQLTPTEMELQIRQHLAKIALDKG